MCYSETTAALHSRENLWPGLYQLQVMLSDAQGRSCPADEAFTLHVCTCVDSEICRFGAGRRATSSSELSAAAVGLLLLAAALLLRETFAQHYTTYDLQRRFLVKGVLKDHTSIK